MLKKLSKKGEIGKKLTDDMTSFLTDKLGGIKDIKSFNNEKLHNIEFDEVNTSSKKLSIKVMVNKIAASLLLEPVMMLVAIVLLVILVEVVHMESAYLFAFSYVIILFIPKLRSINENYMSIIEFLPHFSKVQTVLSREGKTYLADGEENIQCFRSAIDIKNVWFRYIPSKEHVLKDINLKIEKNTTVALVGASGGGKSTLISLLLRLQDPEKGSICIDGIDLRNTKRDSFLKIIGIVHQDPYIFHDTIFNNIIYGKTDASKEDVIVAAKMAYAHDFIMEQSDQYNTVVGVRGLRLSGGQKQRIALARALIKNPEILILDEAMSALDNESERFIQEAIEKIKGKETIIVIAHRLSTVLRADKIVVIEQGIIVQEGRHNELVSIQGPYKKYCDLSQFN
ncbi:MAG: phospholipid-lipopolysaccharide ABC transporter [Candidatus Scalindua rubra]|uniref:Phospholipid-lipopolysaccharide ABC transporter n=1 Tax=Candidatus Scalindua rubra TaxID=1872076 RepID=A0A1E3XDR4_9BACT|nr:MAG: phospholipid-lipopolysaccharide ABC transporter [Candidatus Scalindua rubra]